MFREKFSSGIATPVLLLLLTVLFTLPISVQYLTQKKPVTDGPSCAADPTNPDCGFTPGPYASITAPAEYCTTEACCNRYYVNRTCTWDAGVKKCWCTAPTGVANCDINPDQYKWTEWSTCHRDVACSCVQERYCGAGGDSKFQIRSCDEAACQPCLTPSPQIGCNQTCTDNSSCSNGLVCFDTDSGKICRNPVCSTESSCTCKTTITPSVTILVSQTPTPSNSPTLTKTPTQTPSLTPSKTPTSSPTSTPTPSVTPSKTSTPTKTPTPQPCEIGGKKFNDNGDKIFNVNNGDSLEGVSNWMFYLYAGTSTIGTPIASTTTANGAWRGWPNSFKFTNLTCGKTYTIKEESRPGWEASGDINEGITGNSITFVASLSLGGYHFGNHAIQTPTPTTYVTPMKQSPTPTITPTPQKCEIGGKKFEDVNGNKIFDSGDSFTNVSNWRFYLYQGSTTTQSPLASALTAPGSWQGWPNSFKFSGLECGKTYTIKEEFVSGWIPSGDTQYGISNGQITFIAAPQSNGFKFGNKRNNYVTPTVTPTGIKTCQVGGKKFQDNNRNALFDAGDSFEEVKQWNFYLYEGTNTSVNPIKTDTTVFGKFQGWPNSFVFTGLTCGRTYTIKEESRNGWLPSGDTRDGIYNGQVTFTANSLIGYHFGNKGTQEILTAPNKNIVCNSFTGLIKTVNSSGNSVLSNIFSRIEDVYIKGFVDGNGSGIPNGQYYYKVTDATGAINLYTDSKRNVNVTNGIFPITKIYPINTLSGNSQLYKVWFSQSPIFTSLCTKTALFSIKNISLFETIQNSVGLLFGQ